MTKNSSLWKRYTLFRIIIRFFDVNIIRKANHVKRYGKTLKHINHIEIETRPQKGQINGPHLKNKIACLNLKRLCQISSFDSRPYMIVIIKTAGTKQHFHCRIPKLLT